MKVELLKTLQVNGEHCKKGDVVEVSDFDGNYIVNRGYASKVEEAEAESKPKAKAKK